MVPVMPTAEQQKVLDKANARGLVGYAGSPGENGPGDEWPGVQSCLDAGLLESVHHYNLEDPTMHWRRDRKLDRRIYRVARGK